MLILHQLQISNKYIHRVSKKVTHHTVQNIFAQGWPIAKISTATESEIISEHKDVINVLIFNVPKCCHLANYRVSNWQLCMQCTKTAHYFEGLWSSFCPFVAWLLIALENNPFLLNFYDVTWPRKVKLLTPMRLEPDISKTAGDRDSVPKYHTNKKWPIGYQMVTWPMSSHDPERSNSWPQYA